jgi:hypothetical protein
MQLRQISPARTHDDSPQKLLDRLLQLHLLAAALGSKLTRTDILRDKMNLLLCILQQLLRQTRR